MASVRWFAPGVCFYEIVSKCCGDQMLMRPDDKAVFLIALAMSGALLKHKRIKLVAVCVVSNHMHLIVAVEEGVDPRGISAFLKTMNQAIAQDLNRHRGRIGHFFRGKPSIIPILDEDALAERMAYVHAQPVHHDLVAHVEAWPGLSSFRVVRDDGVSIDVSWFEEDAWREAGADPANKCVFTRTTSVPVTTPTPWEGLSRRGQRLARRTHAQQVHEAERLKAIARRGRGQGEAPKGGAHYTTIDPYMRPVGEVKRTPAPLAHGSEEAVARFVAAYDLMLESYRVASLEFRTTGVLCMFPPGTFPPWVGELVVA